MKEFPGGGDRIGTCIGTRIVNRDFHPLSMRKMRKKYAWRNTVKSKKHVYAP